MTRRTPGNWSTRSWRNIFDDCLIIPMNQRCYEWSETNVTKFIEDAIDIFENTNCSEVLGSLIIFNGPDGKECFDGQQRIITTILTCCAISFICNDKYSDTIYGVISENLDLAPKITTRMNEFTEKYGYNKRMPKLHCISPDDNDAMCDIFNGYEPFGINYNCKHCGKTMSTKTKYINHLVKFHEFVDTKNKIYIAFNTIYEKLLIRNFEINQLKDFFKFLMNNVEVQVYDTDDADYACRLFEWTNNRGSPVTLLDVRKNIILSRVSDVNKMKVFEKWNSIKNSENGEKILNCSVQIYNNLIKREKTPEINCILRDTKTETYKEIKKLFVIAEKLFEIYDLMSKDRFGRLLFHSKNISVSTEIVYWFLLPIFYRKGTIDEKLIHLVAKFIFRNLKKKTRTFNNLSYSNTLIDISNKYFDNKNFDYYNEFIKLIKKEKDIVVLTENYVQNSKDFNWKSFNDSAKMLLYFLETSLTPDHVLPELTLLDLEHIVPKSKGGTHFLGNLTLLESKNSVCGQKGNRSIQDCEFEYKRIEYKKSSCVITREIAELETFDETKRNQKIYEKLNVLTDY